MDEPLDLSRNGATYYNPPKNVPVKKVARRLEFSHEIKISSPKPPGPDDSDPLIALSPLLNISDVSSCNSSMSDVFTFEDQKNVPLDLTVPKSQDPCFQQQVDFGQQQPQGSPQVPRPNFICKLSRSYQLYQQEKQQNPTTFDEKRSQICFKSNKKDNPRSQSETHVIFINQTNIPTLEIDYIFSLNFQSCDGSEVVDVNGTTFRIEAEAPVTCNSNGFVRHGRCIVVRNENGFLEKLLLLDKSNNLNGPATDTLLYSISTRYVMTNPNVIREEPDSEKIEDIRSLSRSLKNEAILNMLTCTKVKLDLTKLNNPDFEYCFGKSEWTIRFLESWKLRIIIKLGNIYDIIFALTELCLGKDFSKYSLNEGLNEEKNQLEFPSVLLHSISRFLELTISDKNVFPKGLSIAKVVVFILRAICNGKK